MTIQADKEVLKDTRCLYIGPMEKYRDRGLQNRNRVERELEPLGIVVWNHYKNPILSSVDEGDNDIFQKLLKFREDGDFENIAKYKQIRNNDLALIDKCDFVICELDMDTLSCGTWEELFLAIKLCKPIMLYCVQGKKSIPLWLFWSLKVSYIYNDLDEIIDTIKKIDCGDVELTSDKWKLLKKEYR